MIIKAIGGASLLTRRTASAPSPPIAIRGASGLSTAPRPSVAKAARMMAGSSRPVAGPPPV
jgi:hypothetical protein